MLALYQEEQEILYKHIKSILPDGQLPVRDPRVCDSMAADLSLDV